MKALECEVEIVSSNGELSLSSEALNCHLGASRSAVPRALARLAESGAYLIHEGLSVSIPVALGQTSADSMRRLGIQSGSDYTLGEMLFPWLKVVETIRLYPFQVEGVEWLKVTPRAVLADDMGLGKTIQAIQAMRDLVQLGDVVYTLIVAPRSLIYNWIAELTKWAPELCLSLVMPNSSASQLTWENRLGKSHVVLTSYEQLRSNPALTGFSFDLVIADEAHRLRNRGSDQSMGFRKLQCSRMWLLSGTPIERDLEDLLTLMSLLMPSHFAVSDQKLLPALIRSRARPFILRRLKNDVLHQLPKTTEIHEYIELTRKQRAAYDEANIWTKDSNPLTIFGRLRAICDLESETGESAKLDRALDLVREIVDGGESVVVFSFWNDPLRAFASRLAISGIGPVYVYTSDLTISSRNQVVEEFKVLGGVLLASGHIASEGLTLVKANHVVFLNQWWNPSQNRQAADRIRRIGQDKPTFTYKFTSLGTLEEAIDGMIHKKTLTEQEFIEHLAVQVRLSYEIQNQVSN